MKRWLLSGVIGAVLVMIWGFLFWATPLSMGSMKTGADEEILRPALLQSLPEDGVYFVPGFDESHEEEAFAAAHREGPLATVFFVREGSEPMRPAVFVMGFVHTLVSVLLLGLLLRLAAPALPGYGARVGFVFLAALTAAVWANLGKPIWYSHPWTFYAYSLVYDVVAWLLAGLVLARFIRPAD